MSHRPFPRKYTNQLIIQFLSGVGDDVITDHEEALNNKAYFKHDGELTSQTITLTPRFMQMTINNVGEDPTLAEGIREAVGKMTNNTRVYLCGHGDWVTQTLGGFSMGFVASVLNLCQAPNDSVISVVGCQLARDKRLAAYGKLCSNSINSFGSKLHQRMWSKYQKKYVLFARTYNVGVYPDGKIGGRKLIFLADTLTPKVEDQREKHPKSKVMFCWAGDTQVRRWVDYEQYDKLGSVV